MEEKEQKLNDFVQIPRKIRDDYMGGKLTRHELDVLIWIWLNTNPYNGSFNISYAGLVQDFRGELSEVNARKIISSLRKDQYIHFTNHKGRVGSFPIYPLGFPLTSKKIQTLESLKNKELITAQTPTQIQPDGVSHHNLDSPNHNLGELMQSVIKDFPDFEITTPYNDNDNNKNNEEIGNEYILEKKSSSVAYKKNKIIPVEGFGKVCKTYEQQRCWEIAEELEETDMRFLLSCLEDYGINHIEKAWIAFEKIPQDRIQNPRKYFNKLIRNLDKS